MTSESSTSVSWRGDTLCRHKHRTVYTCALCNAAILCTAVSVSVHLPLPGEERTQPAGRPARSVRLTEPCPVRAMSSRQHPAGRNGRRQSDTLCPSFNQADRAPQKAPCAVSAAAPFFARHGDIRAVNAACALDCTPPPLQDQAGRGAISIAACSPCHVAA